MKILTMPQKLMEIVMRRKARGRVETMTSQLGFKKGFTIGFASLILMASPDFAVPRTESRGLKGDWRAVGGDFRKALRRSNELRKVG